MPPPRRQQLRAVLSTRLLGLIQGTRPPFTAIAGTAQGRRPQALKNLSRTAPSASAK